MRIGWIITAIAAFPCTWMSAQNNGAASDHTSTPAKTAESAPLQLNELLQAVLSKNPELQSASYRVNALQRRISQAQALPDPTVAVGWAGNLTPFSTMPGDPSSYRGITVSEQLPYPGKLKLQGDIAAKDVEVAQSDYEAIRRRIAADVKVAYYDYFYYQKAIEATNQNKDLLEKFSAIAEAQYRVGKGMQQDVLRSQVEISMLLEKLTVLEQQRATAQARINAFLQQSPEEPLGPAVATAPETIHYALPELYLLAEQNDPAVIRNQKIIDRGQINVSLAERQYRPDFGVSYMFQQRTNQADMNGLTIGVTIPVFYKTKQREAVQQAVHEQLSAEKMRDNRLNEVRFELKQQYLAAQAAEQLLTLYSKGVVPQSSLALESSMASYQVGKLDFLSLISNFTTMLAYETDYYRQLADHESAIARIEALTGTDITSQPPVNAPATAPLPAKREM